MRRLIAPLAVLALSGAVGCGEEESVPDNEIVRALDLKRDQETPVYAIGGDEFCQVEEELLNDPAEVEEATSQRGAQVIASSDSSVGIQVVTPFDPLCEQEAQRALNRLGKADEG